MFSYQPSYYTTSPFDSYYVQPDPFRRAALIRRQREIEAARLEQARREQARLAEAHRIQQLRRQQEEAQLREAYAQQMRDRRRSQFYAQSVEDNDNDDDEEQYYQHPFFPFPFAPPRRERRQSTASARLQRGQAVRPQSQSSSPVNIPISSVHQSNAKKTPSSSHSNSDAETSERLDDRRNQAATIIQAFWRAYVLRRKALAQIATIRSSYQSLQSAFTFPTSVDFAKPFTTSSSFIPPLAYTANNRPILGYEHSATQLLTQLDAVDSAGDAGIRAARKALVNEIEGALKALEDKKAEAWRAQQTSTTSAPLAPIPSPEVIAAPSLPEITSTMPEAPTEDAEMSSPSEEEAEEAIIEAAVSEPEDAVFIEEKDADEDADDDDAWVDASDEILEDDRKDAESIAMQLDDSSTRHTNDEHESS